MSQKLHSTHTKLQRDPTSIRAGIALIVATEVPLPPCTANLHVPHTRHILGVLLGVPSMPSMCRVCSWTVEFTGAVCARRSTLSLFISHAAARDTNPKRKRGRRTICEQRRRAGTIERDRGQRCAAIEESDRSARRDAGGHIGDKRDRLPVVGRTGRRGQRDRGGARSDRECDGPHRAAE
jgi:hypothetical protein